jgi:hypothetical protein
VRCVCIYMKTKFNLSEKIVESKNVKNTLYLNNVEFICKTDVKEFIKLLKEERPMKYSIEKWIDELAGEKLI